MPMSKRTQRKIRNTALSLLTFLAALVVWSWTERTRNASEEYAVYSAYLSGGLLNDAHDWSVDGPVQVVIENTTKGGGNLRLRALYVLDGGAHIEHLDPSTRVNFIVRNLLETRILPRFALPSQATVALASQQDIQSPQFQKRFPHNLGFITLSGVGFNRSRTQALFYIDHFCGLCGGGRYVLMKMVNGTWQIQAENYTWIS